MENGKNFPPDTIPRIEEEKRETGPPPEAPVPVPLTEAQRRFAAQYHALIYGFLLEKKLEIREYYDIAAIGYLHAVQRYFTEKSLHKIPFLNDCVALHEQQPEYLPASGAAAAKP